MRAVLHLLHRGGLATDGGSGLHLRVTLVGDSETGAGTGSCSVHVNSQRTQTKNPRISVGRGLLAANSQPTALAANGITLRLSKGQPPGDLVI